MNIFENFKASALWPYILLVPAIIGGIDLLIFVVYIIYYKKTRKD